MIKINGDNFVVTGGAGFIGSHICEELVKQDKRVTVIDNNMRHDNLGWWNSTLCSFAYKDVSVDSNIDVLCDNADTIFNQSCSKCTVCKLNPLNDLMTNAWGSFRVFDAARKTGAKVIHASTGSVYGDGLWNTLAEFEDGDIKSISFKKETAERDQYMPKSFYGVSKLAGEQYLRAFEEYYGLRFVALRYFHVYGPRQDAGPNGGVVAIFITKMLKGEPLPIFGDGEQVRSFTYVKDVVKANFLAANSTEMEGEYYNVASGVRISLNQLIETLESIMGKKAEREYHPAKLGDIRDFNVSNAKIASVGMGEWTEFGGGLRETVGWYRAQYI